MARFDVYPSPAGPGYVLDLQADILDGLVTRVVVPLIPATIAPTPARRLNPVSDLGDAPHVMVTQFLAAVPRSALGEPIATLAGRHAEIANALDMLFIGF